MSIALDGFGRKFAGKYIITPRDSTTGRRINVLWIDPLRGTMWGCGANGVYTYSQSQSRLMRSDDNGATWINVATLGTRNQTTNGVLVHAAWPDMIYSVMVVHAATPANDVLLVSSSNFAANYDGALFYSSGNIYTATPGSPITLTQAKYGDDQGMGTGANFYTNVGTGYPSWSIDSNGTYAVIGEYSGKSATGAWDRSVWMSTAAFGSPIGSIWKRIWYQPGDGSNGAKNLHCHMVRIDPDGGCWLSFGDHARTVADQTDYAKGMWHSVTQPTPITSGKPAAQNTGSFTAVYTAITEYARNPAGGWPAVRPITGMFCTGAAGQKYYVVGEDSMTPTEARTITSIRYDDASYLPQVNLNAVGAGTNWLPMGGIFGTCQIDDNHLVAFATSEGSNNEASRPALFVSSDSGNTWSEDVNFAIPQAAQNKLLWNAKSMQRNPDANGYVWFGRAWEDACSFGYRPVFV